MNTPITYVKSTDQLSSKLGEEVVLLSIEEGKYFKMNEIGSSIWAMLEEPRTLAELVQKLLEEYDVTEEECMAEAKAYIEKLSELNLVSALMPS